MSRIQSVSEENRHKTTIIQIHHSSILKQLTSNDNTACKSNEILLSQIKWGIWWWIPSHGITQNETNISAGAHSFFVSALSIKSKKFQHSV